MKKILGLLLLSATVMAGPNTATIEQNLGGLMYRNFIINSGAERNITRGITDSSGIVTRSTTTPIEGNAEFQVDATATSQNVDWATNTLDQGLKNGNCEARWVIEGDATLYKVQVLINSVVVAENTALSNYTNPQIISINYPCGDLSTATALRLASTGNGAQLQVDSVSVSKATNIGTVTQATLYGTANAYQAASCNWSTASASLAAFSADTDCATPAVTGGVTAPATKIPAIKMLNAPPGKYVVTATFQGQNSTGNPSYALSDGTTTAGRMQGTSTAQQLPITLVGVFEYTTAGDRQIDVYGRAGGTNAELTANSAFMDLSFTVQKFPSQNQIVSIDQANTDWTTYSVTIGATTTPPTPSGATSLAKWRRIGDSMEIMYYFAQSGSGTAGSGTYLFPIPSGYTIDTNKVTATTAAIGTTGHPVGNGQASNTTSAVATTAGPATVFVYNTTNLFLTHTFSTGGQLNPIGSSEISIGGTAYIAFRALVPITGWGSTNTWLIAGSVSSNSTGQERLERARITNSGTPAVATQSGTWISSITDNFTGDMTLNFVAGIFSSAPQCVCIPETSGSAAECYNYNTTTPTSSVWRLQTRDSANAAGDYDLEIFCMGAK